MPRHGRKFETVANDYNSPFIRNYIWSRAFFSYPKILKIPKLVEGIYSEGKKITYVADMKSWLECHEQLKKKALADSGFVEKIIDRTISLGDKFNDWTEKNIWRAKLEKLSGQRLIQLYRAFIEGQSNLYAWGVALPILDFQGFEFVEGNLRKFLKSRLPDAKFAEYFKIFTTPAHNSFAQDQEEDLLRLMTKFYDRKKWRAQVRNKSLTELKRSEPGFVRLLQIHTRKYCWVYYVYAGPAFTADNFLEFIRDYLKRGVVPKNKLNEIFKEKQVLAKKKAAYLKTLRPDKFNLAILKLAGKLVWGKPRRKDMQSKSYYHLEKLQREIGRRLNLSLGQVRSAPINILEAGLAGRKIDVELVNKISICHFCLPNKNDNITVLAGPEARNFFEENVIKPKVRITVGKELKGTCAYAGQAKGRVKLVNLPEDMVKMNEGDILVSTATTPSIVPAMKKAAAIITDEGGLTCHASIVSRELKIPCVVGTKIAARVLKDGDLVEVDASRGIVKKI